MLVQQLVVQLSTLILAAWPASWTQFAAVPFTLTSKAQLESFGGIPTIRYALLTEFATVPDPVMSSTYLTWRVLHAETVLLTLRKMLPVFFFILVLVVSTGYCRCFPSSRKLSLTQWFGIPISEWPMSLRLPLIHWRSFRISSDGI